MYQSTVLYPVQSTEFVGMEIRSSLQNPCTRSWGRIQALSLLPLFTGRRDQMKPTPVRARVYYKRVLCLRKQSFFQRQPRPRPQPFAERKMAGENITSPTTAATRLDSTRLELYPPSLNSEDWLPVLDTIGAARISISMPTSMMFCGDGRVSSLGWLAHCFSSRPTATSTRPALEYAPARHHLQALLHLPNSTEVCHR